MEYLFTEWGHFKDWSSASESRFYGQNLLMAQILLIL